MRAPRPRSTQRRSPLPQSLAKTGNAELMLHHPCSANRCSPIFLPGDIGLSALGLVRSAQCMREASEEPPSHHVSILDSAAPASRRGRCTPIGLMLFLVCEQMPSGRTRCLSACLHRLRTWASCLDPQSRRAFTIPDLGSRDSEAWRHAEEGATASAEALVPTGRELVRGGSDGRPHPRASRPSEPSGPR